MKKKIFIVFIFFVTIVGLNCSVLKTMTNISRLKFKIGNTSNLHLAGVSLEGKRNINDFSSLDALKLSAAFIRGSIPLTFTLYVDAENPNDGTGGYARTNATITSFPWRLFIDDKETITGNIGAPVSVPGTGEVTVMPLSGTVDLVKFFKNKGYEGILNLALNLAGQGTRPTKLALFAQPTVQTTLGNIKYPEEIKIVSLEYSK
ncbi:MAG TPA: hypothetical protein VJ954_08250 [Ignavibacteriaceae bacterium]|nr:hypothetical protein [Ignavibacteriaceae bacterium]